MISNSDSNRPSQWEQRFKVSQIFTSQIAKQNHERGLVSSNQGEFIQWFTWGIPSGSLTQVTDTAGGHANPVTLSVDGRFGYTLRDFSGNETGHYVQIDLEAGLKQTPTDLTPSLPNYSSFGFALSGDGSTLGFIAVYNNTFHLYTATIGTDGAVRTPTLVTRAADHTLRGIQLSYDGEVAYVGSNRASGTLDFGLAAIETKTGREIGYLWDGPGQNMGGIKPSPGKGQPELLAKTTKGGTESLLIWAPHSGERKDLQIEGISGSIQASDWSSDGTRLLCFAINQAEKSLFIYHLKNKLKNKEITPLQTPAGISQQEFFSPDGTKIHIHHEAAATPIEILAFDGHTGVRLPSPFPAAQPPAGRPFQSFQFSSTNDQMIQGWLGRPDPEIWGEGPYPVILNTHGGPQAVQTNRYMPDAQVWMECGYLYVTINYHGSTTFGKAFEASIWGNPGDLEVEDIVSARSWLIEQGIGDESNFFLEGRSYGGYLTLQTMGKYPGLWAGGMATVAIADWAIQYEDTAETLRAYQTGLLGGTPTEVPEQYAKSSPITYAERIDAPILIIQGRHDSRTPARPVELYEQKLKGLGKEIEVVWYETGHAGAKTSTATAIYHMELRLGFAERTRR